MEEVDLSSDSRVTVGLAFAILPAVLLWYYRSLTKPYSGFPSYPAFYYFTRSCLKGGWSSKIPMTASILQFFAGINKIHERDEFLLMWWGSRPTVFLNSVEAIKFFINEPAAIEKSTVYDAMKMALGNGLVTSNAKVWAQHRKIINPTFQRRIYKSYMPVYNRRGRQLVEDLRRETEKPWIDIAPFIKTCTFYIICETVMGMREDSVVHGDFLPEYFSTIASLHETTIHRMFRPWLQYESLLPLFLDGQKLRHRVNFLKTVTRQVIKEMLESPEANDEKPPEDEDSDYVPDRCRPFIRSFVEAHRKDPESFTLQDIEDELTTFMIAGYETTSEAFISAVHLLGLHPEVQERAFEDIDSNAGGEMTYEGAQNLPYLESIVKETLRLFPPAPLFSRRLGKDVQYGKYAFPKNTNIVFFPYFLHRNPETFPNPEKFDPDRFSPENMGLYGRYSYMPFAEGPRQCIGQKFAMTELKVILSHIIRNFRIVSLDPRDKMVRKWNVVLSHVDPTRIRLIPRQPTK